MFVLGLTGGIASGKSAVSAMLSEMGFPIVDADVISRRVAEKGSPVLESIKKEFGEGVLNDDGTLNRKALGILVFGSSDRLKKLNSLTHPAIVEEINKQINYYIDRGDRLCVLDAPLLIESGINGIADRVLLVYVDSNTQMERLMNRDGITEELAMKKISSQMSFEEKRRYADYIIDNTGSLMKTKEQLKAVVDSIKSLEEGNG